MTKDTGEFAAVDRFVSLVVGEQRERIPITNYHRGYYWTCQECGWLGTGLLSLNGAMKEAGDHWEQTHGGPLVAPPVVERRDQEGAG